MLVVRVLDGEQNERILSFEKPTVMIGRAEGNDVCLMGSKGVSRYHARADVEKGKVSIQDLNSTNGTLVNGSPVEQAPITPQDEVRIGGVSLFFTLEEEEEDAWRSELDIVLDTKTETTERKEESSVDTLKKEEDTSTHQTEDDFYWSSLEKFLGPVWSFITDEKITEIMINSPSEIYVEEKGHLHQTDAVFTEAELKAAVLNIAQYVGRRVSEQEPYLDARLPDGSRVAILLPPCSRKGICIAIRKFSKDALTLDKLLGFGSLSEEMITFVKACVVLRKNIIISGGTSSGKTSLLNVVSGLIPEGERILTIEDSAELQLRQEHVVPMETKPPDKKGRGQVTIRDLVKTSLRMRPDRIVVGEIRGGEALDLLQAMNTGHSGSMATVHASSPPQALTRLETLSLFSGIEIPVRALRDQVSSAIEIIVQAARLPDHSRKVTHISEVGRLDEKGEYQVRDIFRFERSGSVGGKIQGEHMWTGEVPSIIDEIKLAGLSEAISLFEQENVE